MTAFIASWATTEVLGMDADLTCGPSCRFVPLLSDVLVVNAEARSQEDLGT